MSVLKAGDRRYGDSGWGGIACHSFVIWGTAKGQEWKIDSRLGTGHRQTAEKESMVT